MTIQLEEVATSRRTSILLVASEHFGWYGLRMTLQHERPFEILEDARPAAAGLRLAGALQPDAMFVASDVTDSPIVVLSQGMHTVSPVSKLLVLGDRFDEETLLALERIPVDALLTWAHLSSDTVRLALECVQHGLRVRSAVVATDGSVSPTALRSERHQIMEFTEAESAVVRDLALGLKEKEIAKRLHVSLRTVEDTVSRLKLKLAVDSIAALTARAVALGLDPWER
jgi:DNA-binding NarL/FixJ family response regulator